MKSPCWTDRQKVAMNPYVKDVAPLPNHRLLLNFENGETRIFDATPYLERGVFKFIHHPDLFALAKVVAGSVEWPGEIDLSYDTLYLESQPVTQAEAA
jgi:hypothetical protein